VDGVDDVGFVIDVDKGGATNTLRIPAREAAAEHDALGVAFKISNHDEGTFIALDAHR